MPRPRLAPIAALRRFARAQRGAIAVEFAIIALPFMVLIFGIIELGMVFLVSTTLQNATDNAARKIRTGEFQTSGANTKSDFKNLVCESMTWLKTPCITSNKLTVDVQTFANFATLNSTGPTNPTTFDPNSTCWSSGQPGDIVLVRTYYQWDVFTPLLNAALVNMGSGSNKRLINAATSFRNEPWSTQTPTGPKC
ncbi:MAG TPA: TadE/TadG family type IV pilus assembly protein [Phenylobacterium sp.]|nr:TadE/TadG family type IV pilus assembly protein [Phenylobacterium sp.]